MEGRRKYDRAVGESEGNGGDIAVVGNDIAGISGRENQVYLALFGGNVEGDTPPTPSKGQNLDWWGNSLLLGDGRSQQFNSKTERTLNDTPLNSAGRIRIENAVKDDLKFLQDLGAKVNVSVIITGVNQVQINIDTIYPVGQPRLTIIKFTKSTDGDFSPLDFSEDFY